MMLSEMSNTVRKYRERLLADPYRPVYHFTVPDSQLRRCCFGAEILRAVTGNKEECINE